jgi:voltage-gated potassium channel
VFQRIHGHYRFMNHFWREIGAHLRGPVGVFLATATMTSMLVVTVALYAIERDANARLDTWFDALYLTVTTMTGVGYGDIAPITTAGRTVAMLAMLFGTAIFAGFTALFASAILEVGRSRSWARVDERA